LGEVQAEQVAFSLGATRHVFAGIAQPVSLAVLDEPEEPEPEPIRQSDEIDPSMPMVALTFDDGPVWNTERILDLLAEYNVRATFCIIGEQAESGRDIIIRAFEEDHEIIGHSWSHRNLARLSARDIENELASTNEIIESITGVAPRLHRAPFGAINARVRDVSESLDLSILGWSVDPRDWEIRDADSVYESIIELVEDGSIIVCHDTRETTAEAMERVLPELITRGYQLVTASELFMYKETELLPGELYRKAGYTSERK
jgi:peptidoglycan/xylan/chitin deacetylase (PgdA/CDA1 family)